jgi:hypothetical protein
MKFSLIHPSRSRPEKSISTMMNWIARSAFRNLDIILIVDYDDHTLKVYYKQYEKLNFPFLWLDNQNDNAIQAINKGAKEASGDILIVISDDTDCPINWDKILTDAIGQSKDFVMKVDDGIQKRIITMPIMDRAYYNRDGRIYNPIYSHSWSDTELTEVAHLRGRIITRMDIKFPHRHYSVIGEQPDELYKRNDLTHDRDRHIYQNRKRINFGL